MNDTNEDVQPSTVFILTGFGAFQGVEKNPTMSLVQHFCADPRNDVIHAQVFETSAQCVQQEIDQWFSLQLSFNRNNSSSNPNPKNIIILMLGVNSLSSYFSVESCCYNDASFRIPDQQGFQPWQLPIVSTQPLGTQRETQLNIDLLMDTDLWKNHTVVISRDPGRFVCNYTYFYALNKALEWNETRGDTETKVHALFVHVPSFDVVPETQQLNFVHVLLDTIKQLT